MGKSSSEAVKYIHTKMLEPMLHASQMRENVLWGRYFSADSNIPSNSKSMSTEKAD